MSILRPAQVTNDASSIWMNAVQDNLVEQRVSVSSDFIQTSGPTGKFISLHPKHKYTPTSMNYRGEWNAADGYRVNDVVRVMPGVDYFDMAHYPWKDPPSVAALSNIWGFITTPNAAITQDTLAYEGVVQPSGSTISAAWAFPKYYPVPGTYICVSNIPSMDMYAYIFKTFLTSFGNLPSSTISYGSLVGSPKILSNINYVRMWDVNYFPTWPEMTNKAILNPNDLTKTWGRYWELISLLPTRMNVCIDGEVGTSYVDTASIPSGSANYTGSV